MTLDARKRVVRGEVSIPADAEPVDKANVVVQVEDVSRADAPSIVVGEQRQQAVQLDSGGVIPFWVEIPAELIDPVASYSIRVHIDRSGSGTVDVGDLVTTQSYPVLTHGYSDDANVSVRQV